MTKRNSAQTEYGTEMEPRYAIDYASDLLHSTNVLLVLVLIQGRRTKVAPPLEQHGVADKLEPGGEFQPGLLEHCLKLIS